MGWWKRWRTRAHWRTILRERMEKLSAERSRAADPEQDRKGHATSFLHMHLRTIGACEYIVNRNVDAFRANLAESARVEANLFRRYDSGEKDIDDYASMVGGYRAMLNALACGNREVAMELARVIGGRPEIESKADSSFTLGFGYSLKYLVLGDDEAARPWVSRFAQACAAQRARNYAGYPRVLEAILDRKPGAAQRAFLQVVAGHQREARGSGSFRGTVDEQVCVWGVGVANLCRWRGLPIEEVPPLIPDELLV